MATLAWVVFKHHKKSDGTYNPKIRVYHKGTTSYMATPIYTQLVRFRKGEATGTITDGNIVDSLNGRVKSIRQLLNAYDYVIEECEDAKAVVSFIDKKINQEKNLDFIAFAREYVEGLPNNGTRHVKEQLIIALCRFVQSDSLPVRKITSSFLSRFESWLRSTRLIKKNGKERKLKPLANSSIQTYMQNVQTLYNKMLKRYNDYEINDIVITGDPFKVYDPHQDFTYKKKAVGADIIRKIVAYKSPKEKYSPRNYARDMFLLSFCLAGMNIIDIFNCDSYIGGRIDYRRTKTRSKKKDKAFISVPVYPEVQEIFNAYRDADDIRVFDLYKRYAHLQSARQGLAYGMKMMCKDLGIDHISFYAARHSFATIARNDCNVSMEDIALCLTHASGFRMTDTYVKPDFSRVDKVIRKVLDYVFH